MIKTEGLGIGLTKDTVRFNTQMHAHKQKLKPGDTIIFYTDGVIEAARTCADGADPDHLMDIYGEERFYELLKSMSHGTATQIHDSSCQGSLEER